MTARHRNAIAGARQRAAVLAIGLATLGLGAPAPVRAEGTSQSQTCVDVRIGDERYYDCLNTLLRQSVPQQPAPLPQAPLTATSPPNAVGTFNEQAVRQMMGNNFGVSVVPQRAPDAAAGLPTPFVRGSGAR
jgi:hypothetical protein